MENPKELDARDKEKSPQAAQPAALMSFKRTDKQ